LCLTENHTREFGVVLSVFVASENWAC
jgi:hypothetical protein